MNTVINRELQDGKAVEIEDDFYFVPGCAHHSFESNFSHITDSMQLEHLRNNLGNDPVSCPKNCTFYENRKWGRMKSVGFKIIDLLPKLWKGFAGLSWQTQVAIIALIVLVITPKWAPLLISLAKAIWGKS